MRVTEDQLQAFLNSNPHASELFFMCKESVPTSEVRATLLNLLQDALALDSETSTPEST